MSKRRRTGRDGWESTGGTGDVRPQWYSTSATESAGDTTTTVTVQTPPGIGLVALGGGKSAPAMELLKVAFSWDNPTSTYANLPGAGTVSALRRFCYISNKNFGTSEPALRSGDATVVAWHDDIDFYVTATAASETNRNIQQPYILDLTDGAGHGVLYANQNIYIQVGSSTTGITNTCRVKILYREIMIPESELLGLVLQSNQN